MSEDISMRRARAKLGFFVVEIENNSEVSKENTENSKKNVDKDLVDTSVDENKIQEDVKSQAEII